MTTNRYTEERGTKATRRTMMRAGAAVVVAPAAVTPLFAGDHPVPAAAFNDLERKLRQRIVGQESVIAAVADALRASHMRLTGSSSSTGPVGSLLFLGPAGVGKTVLAQALAESLFGSKDALIRMNVSDLTRNASQATAGTTAGATAGGPHSSIAPSVAGWQRQLMDAVRRQPNRVLLFDEIDNAHPTILRSLSRILDEGRLTDGRGGSVDFRGTLPAMTSSATSTAGAAVGLQHAIGADFLNRIGRIVTFQHLTPAQRDLVAKLRAR